VISFGGLHRLQLSHEVKAAGSLFYVLMMVGLGTGPSPKPLAGLTEAQRESLRGRGLVKLLLKDAQV
jgi:hypothetical protein